MSSKIIQVHSNNEKEIKNYNLGETLNVEINSMSIIPIIADKIYKDPMSSIRELYNNEVTACEKALTLDPNLEQKIEIKLNTDTRELSIQGFNSLGMDSETFKNILRVMGNSGNAQGDSKGLFGIGFYSFFKISERIIIISNSLESKENFAYICKSALKFESLPNENFEKLKESGFKIIVNVKDSVRIEDIENYVKKIVTISGIKTDLIIDGESINLIQYENLEDYFKSSFMNYFEDPYTCDYSLYYEVHNNEDFDFIIGKVEERNNVSIPNYHKTFLVNTPIEVRANMPYNTFYFLNIKNERKYKPTPDRERLEKESEERLNADLDNFDLKNFDVDKLTQPKTIQEFYESPNKWFFSAIGEEGHKIDMYRDVKSMKYTNYNGNHTNRAFGDHLPVVKPTNFIISRTFRKKKFEEYENTVLAISPKSKGTLYDDFVRIGFTDISNKTRTTRSGRTTRAYQPRFTSNFRYHFSNSKEEVINETEVFVIRAKDINEDKAKLYHNIDYRHLEKVCFVPSMADCKALDYEDLRKYFDHELFFTNHGLLNFEQIVKVCKSKKIRYTYFNSDCSIKALIEKRDPHELIVRFKNGKIEYNFFRLYLDLKYNVCLSETTQIKEDFESQVYALDLDEDFKKFIDNKVSMYNLSREDVIEITQINRRLTQCQ
jgi:hypothetical protein